MLPGMTFLFTFYQVFRLCRVIYFWGSLTFRQYSGMASVLSKKVIFL